MSARVSRKLVPILQRASNQTALSRPAPPQSIRGEAISSRFKALSLNGSLKGNDTLFPLTLTAIRGLRPCDAISVLRWSLKAKRHNALLFEAMTRSFECLLRRPPGNFVTIREISDFVDLLRLHRHRPSGNFMEIVGKEISGSRWTSDRFSPCDLVKLRNFFDFCQTSDAEIFAKLDDRIVSRLGHFGASEISSIARSDICFDQDELIGNFCRTEKPEISVLHEFMRAIDTKNISAVSLVELRERIGNSWVGRTEPKDIVKAAECYAMIDFVDRKFLTSLLQTNFSHFHTTDASRLLRVLLNFPTHAAVTLSVTSTVLHKHSRAKDPVFASLALRSLAAMSAPAARPRGWQELAALAGEMLLRNLRTTTLTTRPVTLRSPDAVSGEARQLIKHSGLRGDKKAWWSRRAVPARSHLVEKRRAKSRRRLLARKQLHAVISETQLADIYSMEQAESVSVPRAKNLPSFKAAEPKLATVVVNRHVRNYDLTVSSTVSWRRMRRRLLAPFEAATAHLPGFEYVIPKKRADKTQLSVDDAIDTLHVLDASFPGHERIIEKLGRFIVMSGISSSKQLIRLLQATPSTCGFLPELSSLLRKPEIQQCFDLRCLVQLATISGLPNDTALHQTLLFKALQEAESSNADLVGSAPAVAKFVAMSGAGSNDSRVRRFVTNALLALRNCVRADADVQAASTALTTLGVEI